LAIRVVPRPRLAAGFLEFYRRVHETFSTMRKIFRVTFLVCALLSKSISATPANILIGSEERDRSSAAKSIVYGAVLGTLLATTASLVHPENKAYLFSFFLGAGAAGGLGSYLLQPSPSSAVETVAIPNRFAKKTLGASVTLLAWKF